MGAEVVVVSFAAVDRLGAYRDRHGWPFPVVGDPGRTAYRMFGFASAGWAEVWRPRVVLRYAGLLLRGYRPRPAGEDVHQLGGDVVLDRDRRVVYLYRSADPADRPPAAELIAALASAAGRPGGGTS